MTNREAHYKEAIKACYKYFSLLRDSPLSEEIYEEMRAIDTLAFRFAEKGRADSFATRLSILLKKPVPRSLLLSGPSLTWNWDAKLVRDTLNLLSADNSRIVVMSKHSSMDEMAENWTTEPIYGTQYAVKRLDAEILDAVRAFLCFRKDPLKINLTGERVQ